VNDDTVFEALDVELTDAINNLVIEPGEDDQEKLREMIVGLQVSAWRQGMTMNPAPDKPDATVSTAISGEEATAFVASLLRDGAATITLIVAS